MNNYPEHKYQVWHLVSKDAWTHTSYEEIMDAVEEKERLGEMAFITKVVSWQTVITDITEKVEE